ncbi:MAG: CocE/NonD family hydrolase [Terriglobia bacterium]
MHLKRLSPVLALLILLAGLELFAQEKYHLLIETNVAMKTRDGVTLQADIYRPEEEGKFPVLLERTPYDKRRMTYAGVGFGVKAAARGYVYIIQDCRGRFASEGEWYPFKDESQDGYDAVEWAAALPYANGKVGLVGMSYVGVTQMLTAIAAPPHLAGIMPVITGSNYHENWTYQGGAFAQSFNQAWAGYFAMDTLNRRVLKDSPRGHDDKILPLAEYPLLVPGTASGLAGYYLDWLAHPSYDDYWKQWSIEEQFSRITVPGFHIAAWYDLFQDGSLKNYLGIKAHGGSESAKNNQRLWVTVGGHAGITQKIGDLDFGKESVPDFGALTLRWYDYLLKGVENGLGREKPVKLFVMGKNAWREEEDWPLKRSQSTRYYLHSTGNANTLHGDGALSTTSPIREAPDEYVYDPADPVITRGGPVPRLESAGPVDQRPTETRDDVLVYTAPAFPRDTEVTGPISLELFVSSSAVDTDFTGKLIDVAPNGSAENLLDGILRARYRNSMSKAEFMNPGEIYKLTINLWSTSNVFLKGHRLRLEVSSSNFPRFNRNLNTGEDPERGVRMVKATNHIYHDREHPSALILPIVPE